MPEDLNTTLEIILQELGEMRHGLDRVASEIVETRQGLTREILESRQALDARIDAVEQKLDSFRDETHTNFDEVYRRLERLESEYHAISAALIRVEKMISEERSDREELKREVEELKSRLAALEKKLADLERDLRDDHDA